MQLQKLICIMQTPRGDNTLIIIALRRAEKGKCTLGCCWAQRTDKKVLCGFLFVLLSASRVLSRRPVIILCLRERSNHQSNWNRSWLGARGLCWHRMQIENNKKQHQGVSTCCVISVYMHFMWCVLTVGSLEIVFCFALRHDGSRLSQQHCPQQIINSN